MILFCSHFGIRINTTAKQYDFAVGMQSEINATAKGYHFEVGLLLEIYMTANSHLFILANQLQKYICFQLPMSRLCNKFKLYHHSKIGDRNRLKRLLMPTREHSLINFRI